MDFEGKINEQNSWKGTEWGRRPRGLELARYWSIGQLTDINMTPETKYGELNLSNAGVRYPKEIIMYLSKNIKPNDQWRTDKTARSRQSLKPGPFESEATLSWKPRTPGFFSSANQQYVKFWINQNLIVTLTGFGYIYGNYCAKINYPGFCQLFSFYSSKAAPFLSCRGNHRCSIWNIFNLGFLFPWL